MGCVATTTAMQIMTSPQGAMLWWSTHWCLGTAGRTCQPAPMLRGSPAPAQPTRTDSHGPRNSAASYKVPSSLHATPLYVLLEVKFVVEVFPQFLDCKQQGLLMLMLVILPPEHRARIRYVNCWIDFQISIPFNILKMDR